MKMKHTIEFDEKCKPCKGTGLYVGLAENDGAAVVCYICKGTACHHVKYEYDDFEGKEIRPKVTRVFEINCGIGIGEGENKGVTFKLEDFGGMDYTDWLEDKPFPPKSEMRKFTCPCWWYQSVDGKKPSWKECGYGYFSDCEHFSTKEKCWERWDEEYGV